MRSPRDRGSRQ